MAPQHPADEKGLEDMIPAIELPAFEQLSTSAFGMQRCTGLDSLQSRYSVLIQDVPVDPSQRLCAPGSMIAPHAVELLLVQTRAALVLARHAAQASLPTHRRPGRVVPSTASKRTRLRGSCATN